MRVRWTTDAADDLEKISDYIAEDRPQTARRIALYVVRAVDALDTFPNRGRPGRVEGTRELILAPLPFIAVYEVHGEEVHVLRLLHGAQQWPLP
jgi:toxin ParE1/3/4